MGKHYSKEVTAVILADHARGATAEETRNHIQDLYGYAPNLNTIYAHRKSLTTEQIVDELLRQQERDITKEQNSEVRMRYRDRLLEKLIPIKAEILSKSFSIEKKDITFQFNTQNVTEEDKLAVLDAYRRLNKASSRPVEPVSLH